MLRISGPDLDYSVLTHKELLHPGSSVGWIPQTAPFRVAPPSLPISGEVMYVGQVRYQHHSSATSQAQISKMSLESLLSPWWDWWDHLIPLMRWIFAHLWQSAHSLDIPHPCFFPGSCSRFITVVFEQLPKCEWVRVQILRSLQLYIYFIRMSPTTAFFFHPFLSYLSNNSPLGAERYDLYEEPSLKLLVQELWVTFP